MEIQTVHLHRNSDYEGSRLFYIILPIFAFFIIFVLFFFVANSSRKTASIQKSQGATTVLGTESDINH